MAKNDKQEGDSMSAHWTDEQIVAEMRRLQEEEKRSDAEAALLVLYHGIAPLLDKADKIMNKMDDDIEVENAVTHYKSGEIKRRQEAREKRHK